MNYSEFENENFKKYELELDKMLKTHGREKELSV